MFTFQNNLKELPQSDVILPSLESGSAAFVRGDIFVMEETRLRLYDLYHNECNEKVKLNLAKQIVSYNRNNPLPEYWKDESSANLVGEEWRLIKQWRNHYEASSLGRIRCWYDYTNGGEIKLDNPRLVKQHLNKQEGYLLCGINRERKLTVPSKVNWLVANAFYDNSENLPQSNHIDGIKTNNYKVNLELCSRSYNMKHAFYCGLRKFYDNDNHHSRKLTKEDVLFIRNSDINYYELSLKYKVSLPTIRRVRMAETYTHLTGTKKLRIRFPKTSNEIALSIFNSNKKTSELCKEFGTKDYVVQRIKSGETFSIVTGKIKK